MLDKSPEVLVVRKRRVIHRDSGILGGTTVFVGTRVPVQALVDYLEAGRPLSEFLDDFPTVAHDQAIAVLERTARMAPPEAAAPEFKLVTARTGCTGSWSRDEIYDADGR